MAGTLERQAKIRATRSARRTTWAVAALLVAACSLAACAPAVVAPPLPDVRRVVVLAVDDRTGGALYVDAPPLADVLDAEAAGRVTVPQLLAAELRRRLAARGVEVLSLSDAEPAGAVRDAGAAARLLREKGIAEPALYTRLLRWSPFDPGQVTYVDVQAEAWLVAADREEPLWHASLAAGPISGGNASSIALAYPLVVREVAGRLLGEP